MKARLAVFSNESGEEGVDFVVKTKTGKYLELALQTLNLETTERGLKIPKSDWNYELPENLLVALVLFMNDWTVLGSGDMHATNGNGNVGIGTTTPVSKLDVRGTVTACTLRVEIGGGCDFVFQERYNLLSLKERRSKVLGQGYLMNVKPAAVMEEEGADIAETSMGILQNVEEHELYLYQHDDRIQLLEDENSDLKEELGELKREVEALRQSMQK